MVCDTTGDAKIVLSRGPGRKQEIGGGHPKQEEEAGRNASSFKPSPLPPPPFTLNEIRAVIPPHCFQRSLLKSSAYLFGDLIGLACCVLVARWLDTRVLSPSSSPAASALLALMWFLLWFVQGNFFTGIWVIAHECGHQSFSNSKSINNIVGLILHSCLLVPYHSWRITHGTHHKSNCHLDRDQVYVPVTKHQVLINKKKSSSSSSSNSSGTTGGDRADDGHDDHNNTLNELLQETPLGSLVMIVVMLTVGWPGYLLLNASGQDYATKTTTTTTKAHRWWLVNHFYPSAPMFRPDQWWQIVMSDLGIGCVIIGLLWWGMEYGFSTVGKYYFIPYLWNNFWLVLITFLQHTDIRIPHFRGSAEWSFVRGALATIDRDYGLFNYWHHHIGDSHVVHHMFSMMPHYGAIEATKYVKPILGKYYMADQQTPIWKALWQSFRKCQYVDDDGDIVFYNSTNDDGICGGVGGKK